MNKKIKIIILVILGVILLFVTANVFKGDNENESNNDIVNNSIVNEYTPLEEITGEQARQTVVSLYFKSKTTGELIPEDRRIDSKDLLDEPYKYLVDLLIAKPENEELESVIPEKTTVYSAVLKGTTVEINFSKEFKENDGDIEKIRDAILKTLTVLNEVENISILVDGNEI